MRIKRTMIVSIALVIIILISACPVINRPPREPKLVSPANGLEIQGTAATLKWNCEEPDGDYPISYDIYLGKNANPSTIIQSNLKSSSSTISYTVNSLEIGATYYWRVIAYDNKGSSRNGPVWRFSTKDLLKPPLVFVEKGSFTMGDTWGDGYRGELPVHQVTLTYDLEIGKYELNFDEYDAFCDATGRSKPDDWGLGRGSRPVIEVSWWDAIAYCNWFSEESGLPVAYRLEGEVNEGQMLDANGNVTTDITKVLGYRLPTEAEWEYAARGGKYNSPYKYSGSDNVNDVAWYEDNSGWGTHEVGNKAPNELGIYDMSGNVWEWCSDWYGNYSSSAQTNPYNSTAGSDRVYRGGSCRYSAIGVRVAIRHSYSPAYTYDFLGFRIARTVP